jgi:hypothetical protein
MLWIINCQCNGELRFRVSWTLEHHASGLNWIELGILSRSPVKLLVPPLPIFTIPISHCMIIIPEVHVQTRRTEKSILKIIKLVCACASTPSQSRQLFRPAATLTSVLHLTTCVARFRCHRTSGLPCNGFRHWKLILKMRPAIRQTAPAPVTGPVQVVLKLTACNCVFLRR